MYNSDIKAANRRFYDNDESVGLTAGGIGVSDPPEQRRGRAAACRRLPPQAAVLCYPQGAPPQGWNPPPSPDSTSQPQGCHPLPTPTFCTLQGDALTEQCGFAFASEISEWKP